MLGIGGGEMLGIFSGSRSMMFHEEQKGPASEPQLTPRLSTESSRVLHNPASSRALVFRVVAEVEFRCDAWETVWMLPAMEEAAPAASEALDETSCEPREASAALRAMSEVPLPTSRMEEAIRATAVLAWATEWAIDAAASFCESTDWVMRWDEELRIVNAECICCMACTA